MKTTPSSTAPSTPRAPASARAQRRQLLVMIGLVAALSAAWEGWQRWQEHQQAERLRAWVAPGDLRLISSQTCVFCTRARQWLTRHAIPHSECFIEQDAACAAEYQAWNGPGTPLVIVRQEAQLGFNPERISATLEAAAQAGQGGH